LDDKSIRGRYYGYNVFKVRYWERVKFISEAFWMIKVLEGGIMDLITRKLMRCDCHIAKEGYFG